MRSGKRSACSHKSSNSVRLKGGFIAFVGTIAARHSNPKRAGAKRVAGGKALVSRNFRIMLHPLGRPAGAAQGEGHMHFDVGAIPANEAYKLLVSTVVPRPIALATTVDANGRINAAPFSFFNAVSSVPPVVVLGISPGDSAGDGWKDTERNIRYTGEFVVNLVDEALAERMN